MNKTSTIPLWSVEKSVFSPLRKRVLILGSGFLARDLCKILLSKGSRSYEVVGFAVREGRGCSIAHRSAPSPRGESCPSRAVQNHEPLSVSAGGQTVVKEDLSTMFFVHAEDRSAADCGRRQRLCSGN